MVHADICKPEDKVTLTAFRHVLEFLRAEKEGPSESCVGVQITKFRVGQEVLQVFDDNWSVDIQGPEYLVKVVLNALMEEKKRLEKSNDI